VLEPVIISDSDVDRTDGRIPTGAAEVEWASEEPPQDQQAPDSHAESAAAATLE